MNLGFKAMIPPCPPAGREDPHRPRCWASVPWRESAGRALVAVGERRRLGGQGIADGADRGVIGV